jgi:transcriptional regulator with XRE-family HTH domain
MKNEPHPESTLREFREYFATAYEGPKQLARRIGVKATLLSDWLNGKCQPRHESLTKLRAFLDAEAKLANGDGVRPIEQPVPYKIVKPIQQVRYARICPFCRKAWGKIQSIGGKLFQGVCPKCGASGPIRESHQQALRAWNGRE